MYVCVCVLYEESAVRDAKCARIFIATLYIAHSCRAAVVAALALVECAHARLAAELAIMIAAVVCVADVIRMMLVSFLFLLNFSIFIWNCHKQHFQSLTATRTHWYIIKIAIADIRW